MDLFKNEPQQYNPGLSSIHRRWGPVVLLNLVGHRWADMGTKTGAGYGPDAGGAIVVYGKTHRSLGINTPHYFSLS